MPDDPRRRALQYRTGDDPTEPVHAATDASADTAPEAARQRRPEDQALWVEGQIRAAMARGEFDDLPLAGKPLPHHVTSGDPDWWVKRLVEREQISGVLPPALGLRREDAELDDLLDTTGSEDRARELLEDFNRRVVEARRQLQGGPPVVTPTREVEAELEAWRGRRRARAAARTTPPAPRRPWWRRRMSRG